MSFMRTLYFRRKTLGGVLMKFNSSVLIQRKCFKRMSFLSLRFCHSKPASATLKNGNLLYTGKMSSAYEKNLQFGDLIEQDLKLVLDRFGMQNLDIDVITKYDVRVSADLTVTLFPLSCPSDDCSALQMRTYSQEGYSYSFSELDRPVLFGWSQVTSYSKILIVTSDPIDALAVNQATNIAAVSLPVSEVSPYSFPPEVLTFFKKFEKVIFWMNSDLHSFKIHKLLAQTLEERGFIIRPDDYKNPVYCLQNNFNFNQILKKADPIYNKSLGSIKAFKDVIYQRILGSEAISGVKWKRFTPLNAILKGHRKGEITVITGHTGTGKTTFMCEYALDLCIQGVETLWISLEVSNDRVLTTMLSQFSDCSIEKIAENYDYWIDKFEEELPMLIIILPTCSSLDEIFSAMLSAVRVNNIKHIVVDNLQFMMNLENYNSVLDHLRRQDQLFSSFRNFSTMWNCHVTLVVHPRKEQEFSELTSTSISGTAKTTQEADNVLILQSTKTKQYLEISKNRFDGQRGCVELEFDKDTCTYLMTEMQSRPKH